MSSKEGLTGELAGLPKFDGQSRLKTFFGSRKRLYFWMKEAFQAGAACAPSSSVIRGIPS